MAATFVCERCGASFSRNHVNRPARFCSAACYGEAQRLGRPVGCKRCGKPVYRKPSREGGPYCSVTCYWAIARVTKQCPVCGREFTVSAKMAHRFRACSNACKTRFTRYRDCERCGESFYAESGARRRYFCSDACRYPPRSITCRTCGIEVHVEPKSTRQFCSFGCYRRSRAETFPERLMREVLTELGISFTQEAKVGRYSIDFLIHDRGIAVEVDGEYWHRNKARDARKNRVLADEHGLDVRRIDASLLTNGSPREAVTALLSPP